MTYVFSVVFLALLAYCLFLIITKKISLKYKLATIALLFLYALSLAVTFYRQSDDYHAFMAMGTVIVCALLYWGKKEAPERQKPESENTPR